MSVPMYPSPEELIQRLLIERMGNGGPLDQNTDAAVARLQQPGAMSLTPDPARMASPMASAGPNLTPDLASASPNLVAGSVPQGPQGFETPAGVSSPQQIAEPGYLEKMGGWGGMAQRLGFVLSQLGNPQVAGAGQAMFKQFQESQGFQQMAKAFQPIQAAADRGDHRGAINALDNVLMNTQGRPKEFIEKAFLMRQKMSDTLTKREGINKAMKELQGVQDPGLLVLKLSEYVDADVIKSLAPLLANKDNFTTTVHDENIVVTNKATGKVNVIPIKGAGGGKPTAEQNAKATSITGGKYDFRGLMEAARGGQDPQASQWLAKMVETKAPQSTDRDIAIARITGGKYKSENDLINSGDQASINAVDTQLQSRKVDVSAAQGAAGVAAKTIAERSGPVAQIPGMSDKVIINRETLREVSPWEVTGNDMMTPSATLQKGGTKFKQLTTDSAKQWQNMPTLESLATLYEGVARDFTPSPGVRSIAQAIEFQGKKLGYPGLGVATGGLKSFSLTVARIAQGAGAQLSDNDRKSVEGLQIESTDTQATVLQKAAGLRAMVNLVRAGIADNPEAALKARDEFRASYTGVPKGGARTQGGAIIPPGVR